MRKAKVVVVRNSYKSSDAVSNVLRYMVNSPFSDTEEILSNHVRTDSIENMINDFEEGQKESDLEGHRRLFHYILTKGHLMSSSRCYMTEQKICVIITKSLVIGLYLFSIAGQSITTQICIVMWR